MKMLRWQLMLLAQLCFIHAESTLFFQNDRLETNSEIEIRLDQPITPNGTYPSTTENNIVSIEPALSSQLRWVSPTNAFCQITQRPLLQREYTFSIRPDLRTATGQPLVAGPPLKISSPAFSYQVIDQSSSMNDGSESATPHAKILIFNDTVDPDSLARALEYRTENLPAIPCSARHALWQEIPKSQQNASQLSNWSLPFAEQAKEPTSALPNVVVITPQRPLPLGKGWKLLTTSAVNNRDGTAAIDNLNDYIGDVEPLRITDIRAITPVDARPYINVEFNKFIPERAKPSVIEAFKRACHIESKSGNWDFQAQYQSINIQGNFSGPCKITIDAGFAYAGMFGLEKAVSANLVFKPADAALSLPSDTQAQMSLGKRVYPIESVNLRALRLRLKLIDPLDAPGMLNAFRQYSGNDRARKGILPYDMIKGRTACEKTIELSCELNHSTITELRWNELLPEHQQGLFLVDIEGDLRAEMKSENDYRTLPFPAAQAFVQLTDLGMSWKSSEQGCFVYAFSSQTGKPLSNALVRTFDRDGQIIAQQRTASDGTVQIKTSSNVTQLQIQLENDSYTTNYSATSGNVGLWNFPVNYSWSEQRSPTTNQFLLFTDRNLYRPGEMVHLKGMVRELVGNRVQSPANKSAKLLILNPKGQIVQESAVTLSAQGNFDLDYPLSPDLVGSYKFILHLNLAADQVSDLIDMVGYEDTDIPNACWHAISVQEFRRNAFEVGLQQQAADSAAEVKFAISAQYYQGLPVQKANVQWNSKQTAVNFYPERFQDFQFGDHRDYDSQYWMRYYGYSDEERQAREVPTANGNQELQLDDIGKSSVALPLLKTDFPSSLEVQFDANVTDANQQELHKSITSTIHPATIHVGLLRRDDFMTCHQTSEIQLIAIREDESPVAHPVEVKVEWQQEINEQTSREGENGERSMRNDAHWEKVSEQQTTLLPNHPKKPTTCGAKVAFQPKTAGRYLLTVSGRDEQGREFASRASYYFYGSDDYSWRYREGIKIDLLAEKQRYDADATARILVMTPIEGHAIVTIEREGVLRHFTTELKLSKPVIEVPLRGLDGPNVFVSVAVVKGALASKRQIKEPQYRVGFCTINIDPAAYRLKVALNAEELAATARPGASLEVSGRVMLPNGRAARDAEVTLWLEDEGTLAVAGYTTPDPLPVFYAKRQLQVMTSNSISELLPEDRAEMAFFNKGYFIGGGGADVDTSLLASRKNFSPCALWSPRLICDNNGRFSQKVTLPDTLTRYRVMAIACHEAAYFGQTSENLVVHQPFMIEPQLPNFANVHDVIEVPVLVQNDTALTGEWTVRCSAVAEPGLVTVDLPGAAGEGTRSCETTVTLAAKSQSSVTFRLHFQDIGTAQLRWTAQPASARASGLAAAQIRDASDQVEQSLAINYPTPLLQTHHLQLLAPSTSPQDLLANLPANWRDGNGKIEVEFCQSILSELDRHAKYLFSYPHGCIEQTSSSTIPWLCYAALKPFVRSLATVSEEQAQAHLRSGVDRLISMQLSDGRFSYWPGSTDAVDWATSYAGMVLALAQKQGCSVPFNVLQLLTTALENSLSQSYNTQMTATDEAHCKTLYTLALLGKPHLAEQTRQREQVAQLSPVAKIMLALALFESKAASASEAIALLNGPGNANVRSASSVTHLDFLRLELLARATMEPNSPACLAIVQRMFLNNNSSNSFTTYVSAWDLLACAAFARSQTATNQVQVSVATPDQQFELALNTAKPTQLLSFAIQPQLRLTAQSQQPVFVRLNTQVKPNPASWQPPANPKARIERTLHQVASDGSLSNVDHVTPGDLIMMTVDVDVPSGGYYYLALNLPLPSNCIALNPELPSQMSLIPTKLLDNCLRSFSHSEIRQDRVLNYLDYWSDGKARIRQLLRCTHAGQCTLAPVSFEQMYRPDEMLLSPLTQLNSATK